MWLKHSKVFWTSFVHVCILEDPGVFIPASQMGKPLSGKGKFPIP